MRVVHIGTDSFGGHGGIALYNRELIAAIASHPAVDQVTVVPRLVSGPLEPLPEKVTFLNAAAQGKFAYFQAIRSLRKQADLVVCAHVNLLPVARLLGSAPLLMLYGIEAWKPLREPLSNRLAHGVRAIVSISNITRDRFVGWSDYGGPSHLLPNSIRPEWYGVRSRNHELVSRYGLEGKRVVMTLGRVLAAERYKGFDEMLELMPALDEDVVYLVAGGGDDIPRLQRKATALAIAHRVVFTGPVLEGEKTDLYNLADVYAMPSRGEGFGFVFLEAMACGVPVIASRLDGGREALRNGSLGQLVDPTSLDEIRVAIAEALRGEKCIPAGLDFFSFPNFERRAHAILDTVR